MTTKSVWAMTAIGMLLAGMAPAAIGVTHWKGVNTNWNDSANWTGAACRARGMTWL